MLGQLPSKPKSERSQSASRLSDMNASKIADYSHKDIPWLAAEEGEILDYESVFYRTPEYSVRPDVG